MRWWSALTRDQRLLFLNSTATGFGVSLFLYLQPLYIESLGASPEQIGLTLGVSGLIVILLYIPLGLWADRRGRKPLIVWGWALSAAMTLAMAFAPDWRWFIPAYTLYLLANFAVPALQGYVAATTTPRAVSGLFALLALGYSAGSIIAPAIGGWIGEAFGLRVVYVVAALVFGLDTLIVLAPLTPQAAAPSKSQRAHIGAVLGNRRFIVEIAFILLMFVATDIGTVMAPKYLEEVRGLSVAQIGSLSSFGTLGIAVLTFLVGRLPAERRTPLLLTQALALAALLIWLRLPGLLWIGIAFLIHGGNRVFRPITSARLVNTLAPESMSFGFGFYQTAQQLGLTISPYLAGVLYARDPHWPLWAGVIGLGVAMVFAVALPRR
ncbi:MAG: MFS transporter [Anaerolineales bacterium]